TGDWSTRHREGRSGGVTQPGGVDRYLDRRGVVPAASAICPFALAAPAVLARRELQLLAGSLLPGGVGFQQSDDAGALEAELRDDLQRRRDQARGYAAPAGARRLVATWRLHRRRADRRDQRAAPAKAGALN